MSVRDFREMKAAELRDRIDDLWVIYNRLGDDVLSGKEKDHSKLRQEKREIARALTILNENERVDKASLPEKNK